MENMTPYHTTARLVILAPNWLGDAVMALPAIADVRRAVPHASIAVAARASVAPLFRMASSTGLVDDAIVLERRTVLRARELGAELADRHFDTALLLPNSLHAALTASRAGIRERWGYRTECRGRLLTRAIYPPSGLHQVEYYQQLVHALGFSNGPMEPRIAVPSDVRDSAVRLLAETGWDRRAPLVAIAPGAAYGGAKKWPAASFAALAASLAGDGVRVVMIGTAADRATADEVIGVSARLKPRAPSFIDLVGHTDLAVLAGVFTACRALVTNDSGAMHLAAAVGTRVTAVFGPTDERATRPLGQGHTVITGPAWCRPCMLRECPLDHRCMRGIEATQVATATRANLANLVNLANSANP